MCAGATHWCGFRRVVYGSSIPTLVENGIPQIEHRAHDIAAQTKTMPHDTKIVGGVLEDECDALYEALGKRFSTPA